MESSDVSIFSEKDFTRAPFSAFEDMKKKGELVDCKIATQNRSISAHRLILAARIPLFRKLLASSARGIIQVEEEIDPDVLESVINFAYTGVIKITTENVRPVLLASTSLQITQVRDACWEFLGARICLNNVWETRTLADEHHHLMLVKACDCYIMENFEAFSKSESFLLVPFSYLSEIINTGDARVKAEENTFEAIIRWVKVSLRERGVLLSQLLKAVHMQCFTPEYLIGRVSSEELVRASIPCRDLVDEAKHYHMLNGKKSKCHSFTAPRQECEGKSHQAATCAGNTDNGLYAVCNSSVKLLDSEKREWITLSTRNFACVYYSVAFDGKIYILCKRSTEILNLKTLEWSSLDTVHGSLDSSGVVLHNDVIYSFGGEENLVQVVRRFDPKQNMWATEGKMRTCRKFSGVASLRERIYVTGGLYKDEVFKSVEQYVPETKRWCSLSPMLCSRYVHGCASLQGKIYVFGGFDTAYLGTAEVYDPWTNQWNYISPMKAPRLECSFAPYGGKLYVHGRWPSRNRREAEVEIYDPELNEWKSGIPISENVRDFDFLILTAAPAKIKNCRLAG